MKTMIKLMVVGILCLFLYEYLEDVKIQNKSKDIQKIQKVKSECEYIAKSPYIYKLGDSPHITYRINLSNIHNSDNEAYQKMSEDLGADFSNRLSTGDYIHVTFSPSTRSYEIYAGDAVKDNMLYPEWNYTGMEEVTGFAE